MISRERVITTLNHNEPDRVPLYFEPTIGFYRKLMQVLGIGIPEKLSIGIWTQVPLDSELVTMLNLDIIRIGLKPADEKNALSTEASAFRDDWGIEYKKVFYNEQNGFYFEMTKHPLANATKKDLKHYSWPNVPDN